MEELKLVLSPATPPPERPAVSSAPTQVQTVTLHTPQALPIKTTPPSIKVTPPLIRVRPPPFKATPPSFMHPQHMLASPHPIMAGQQEGAGPCSGSHDPMVPRSPSSHQLPITPAPTLYSSVPSHPLIKHMLQFRPLSKGVPNPLLIPKPISVHRRVSAKTILQSGGKKSNQQCLIIGGPATLTPPTTTTIPYSVRSQQSTASTSSTALPQVQPSAPSQTQCSLPSIQPPPSVFMTPSITSSPLPFQSQPTSTAEPPPPSLQGPAHLLPSGSTQTPLSPSPMASSPPPVPQMTTAPSPPPAPPLSIPGPSSTLKALQLLKALVQESELIPKRRAPEPDEEEEKEDLQPPAKIQTPPLSLSVSPTSAMDQQSSPSESQETPGDSQGGLGGLFAEEGMEEGDPTLLAISGPDRPDDDTSTPTAAPRTSSVNSINPQEELPTTLSNPDTPPHTLHHAVLRCASQSPTASLPRGPEKESLQAVVKPQILTHLVEGFVIQEGLEPFPVSRSSLMVDQQAQEMLMDVDELENSDTDSLPVEDLDELLCEFCGKRGPSHTFVRSQRFCSLQCVKGYNMAYSKRINVLKAKKMGRWASRSDGRRGRPPSGAETAQRERHRQPPTRYGTVAPFAKEEVEEEKPPVPMTTRLRRQAEQNRQLQAKTKMASDWPKSSMVAHSPNSPGLWTVDQVWAFIHSMPGCQDIAEEFRSQEIDGQALLLLTEDHLVGAMKLKLGPALKIHARISDLKGP